MAAASASTAAATAVSAPRFPIIRSTTNCSSLLCLPTYLSSPPAFSSTLKLISGYKRNCVILVRVKSSDEKSSVGETLVDLKEKWDAIENKSTVTIYGGGTLVALWLAATLVSSINSVPLLPKILEVVGLGYIGWFIYRYLLFKSSRKELGAEIEALKKKIVGTE